MTIGDRVISTNWRKQGEGEITKVPYSNGPTNPNPNLPRFQWVLFSDDGYWLLPEKDLQPI